MASKPNANPTPLAPQSRVSLESGLIMEGAVSEHRRPMTSVTESLNFDFDTIGSAKVRKGTTQLGNTLSGNILGIHYHVDSVNSGGTNTQLIIVNGTVAYYLASGTTWTSKRTGLTAGSKARFSTFLNFVFMVNGTEATAIWTGNTGDSFVTNGNAASAPVGKFIENFRSRMWIAGDATYPSRLHYSSVPSSVTTPIITWDTSVTTGQWIDISPSDGEAITGLMRSRNAMLVFKPNHLYRVYSIAQTDPDPYFSVGTSSQESVVETKAGVFFHHSSGFYQYNLYGIVQEISRPIIDIIKAIPTSSYPSVCGWLEADGDRLNWSVGNVTVNGITLTNLVVRYTISTQTWTYRTYPSQFLVALRRQPLYTDGTTQFVVVGDTAGKTFEYNTGTTDAGTAISYALTHSWDDLDGLHLTRKNVQTGLFLHEQGAGTKVNYQIEDENGVIDPESDWSKEVGELKDSDTGFNTMDIKARKVRFRLSGTSIGQQFIYDGYQLAGVVNELMQFD